MSLVILPSRRISLMAVFIPLGLAAGMFGRAYFDPVLGRGEAMLALFEEHCLPVALDSVRPEPPELIDLKHHYSSGPFAHEETGLLVYLKDGACHFYDLQSYPVSKDQQSIIAERFPRLIEEQLPDFFEAEVPESERATYKFWRNKYVVTDEYAHIRMYVGFGSGDAGVTSLVVERGSYINRQRNPLSR